MSRRNSRETSLGHAVTLVPGPEAKLDKNGPAKMTHGISQKEGGGRC